MVRGRRVEAGKHFNALLIRRVRAIDDRPWGCVESFARDVVAGTGCISSGGTGTGTVDLAGYAPKGVHRHDERYPLTKPGKSPRHNYKVNLAYYGPAFAGWAWMPSDRRTWSKVKSDAKQISLATVRLFETVYHSSKNQKNTPIFFFSQLYFIYDTYHTSHHRIEKEYIMYTCHVDHHHVCRVRVTYVSLWVQHALNPLFEAISNDRAVAADG